MKARFRMLCAVFLIWYALTGMAFAKSMSVVFLNPGSMNDIGVWGMSANFMQAAANGLGIDLEILFSDRNSVKMLAQAESVAKRDVHPDFVILVNEKQIGDKMLMILSKMKSKILVMHNGITTEQRNTLGNERGKIKNWIGTVTADDYKASKALIQELCRHRKTSPKVVGISGTKSTPVSDIRTKALVDFLARKGTLYQVVNADWSTPDGKSRAEGLLRRYPDLNIIWAANDSMALGAFEAVKEFGRGKEVSVGGVGGFPPALEHIIKGEMAVSVACHIPLGGWALVLLYDYHNGRDFISDVGVNYIVDHLAVINTPQRAEQYAQLFIEHPEQIDFRRFSKVLNPGLKRYDFSYEMVVKAAAEKTAPHRPTQTP